MQASVVMSYRLSCPTASGILVPRPRIGPESPALAGGFLTTGPPRKSPKLISDDVIETLDHRPLGIFSGVDTVLFFGNLSYFELYFSICKLKKIPECIRATWIKSV